MATTTETKNWGERAGVSLDLLRKFTKPGDPHFGEVQQVWRYRGDLTESGDRRMKESMGEEAHEHIHWDAVACTGGILVVVPRWKFGPERGRGPGLKAEYWWAMSEIEAGSKGVRPARPSEIERVVPETRELLAELPDLEFMHVAWVSYFSHSGNGPAKPKTKPAPTDVQFFRFAAGYGCVALGPLASS